MKQKNPIEDVFTSMMAARTIMAGSNLGIFDNLAKKPMTEKELSKIIKCDNTGTKLILNALWHIGYVKKLGSIGKFMKYNTFQWEMWNKLEEAIKNGGLWYDEYDYYEKHPDVWKDYMNGLKDLANLAGNEIISSIPVRNARKLLDIGGGHAEYSIKMSRKYPNIKADVFDMKGSAIHGMRNVEKAGLSKLINFIIGDFIKDTIKNKYDIVFLFNIIHGYHGFENNNLSLMRKIRKSMNPDAMLVIFDMFMDRNKKRSALSALFSLEMLILSSARTCHFDDVYGWLRKTGFKNIKRTDLKGVPGFSLVTSTKECEHL